MESERKHLRTPDPSRQLWLTMVLCMCSMFLGGVNPANIRIGYEDLDLLDFWYLGIVVPASFAVRPWGGLLLQHSHLWCIFAQLVAVGQPMQ